MVFGPSLATPDGLAAVQRIARTFPEVGVVLLAEELTMALLQDALRAGVRDALTIDAGERQIRQSVERVGETMAGVVYRATAAAGEPARLGKMFVAFSTKGGVGKSVVATNLVGAARDAQPGSGRARSTPTSSSVTTRCCSAFRRSTPRPTPRPSSRRSTPS